MMIVRHSDWLRMADVPDYDSDEECEPTPEEWTSWKAELEAAKEAFGER